MSDSDVETERLKLLKASFCASLPVFYILLQNVQVMVLILKLGKIKAETITILIWNIFYNYKRFTIQN